MTLILACNDYLVSVVEESGERLAVLTTLEGLLRLKHLQMEGEDGTGTLESDSIIMEVSQQSKSGTAVLCVDLEYVFQSAVMQRSLTNCISCGKCMSSAVCAHVVL